MQRILWAEFSMAIFTVAICFVQKWIFKKNIPFNHKLWLGIFSVACVLCWPIWSAWAVVAAAMTKIIIFDPFLNWIRGHDFWYTDPKDPNASELDNLWTDVQQKIIYFGAWILFIALNVLAYEQIIK